MNLRAFSGAALLASVTLVLPAAAVVHAAPTPSDASASTAKPVTGDPGLSRSRTPELTRAKARVAGPNPAVAARSFLAGAPLDVPHRGPEP